MGDEYGMETYENDNDMDMVDNIDDGMDIDVGDNADIEIGDSTDIDVGDSVMNVTNYESRNSSLEGSIHPETGVPFERSEVEINGEKYSIVSPKFESNYDVNLSEEKYQATDREQFKYCNDQLKSSIESDQSLGDKFDDIQLEQIRDGETPDGFTWHHDIQPGRMQLVDSEIHQKTGHTGGRSLWGGGSNNR
ncbi:MAG: HNH endonuclease [Eubacterium sp.]|nr:HNH endonuclease [Eubacterium sp.]